MNHLPPTAASRANSGVSRLALMQAQFQAQQMADKEKRLLAMMETRQEEAVRRIAYGNAAAGSGGGGGGAAAAGGHAHSGGSRIDSAPHSATSLSSNNSSNSFTASVGQRPANPSGGGGGRVRQYFEQQRAAAAAGGKVDSSSSKGASPVGWDKSYPLKPVGDQSGSQDYHQGRPIYKKNSSVAGKNKYSGNYGLKSQASAPQNYYKGRGYSLDRNRARFTSPSRANSVNNMTRTRSQGVLGANATGFSSGEDSYGSPSRPPSSSCRDWSASVYSSRSQRDLISVNNRSNLLNSDADVLAPAAPPPQAPPHHRPRDHHFTGSQSAHNLSRSNSRSNINYGQWNDCDDVIDGYEDGGGPNPNSSRQKTSYTREYVRNLPPASAAAAAAAAAAQAAAAAMTASATSSGGGRASRLVRQVSSSGRLNDVGETSYSSSSEKSEPPAFTVIPSNSSRLSRSTGRFASGGGGGSRHGSRHGSRQGSRNGSRQGSRIDLREEADQDFEAPAYVYHEPPRQRINSQTYRKSPVRQVGLSTMGEGSAAAAAVGVRKQPALTATAAATSAARSQSRSSSASPSRSPERRASYAPSEHLEHHAAGNEFMGDNVSYQALKSQAREEEKRRLQIEMRKRETELLNKIKQQQKELESMKQEKSKVERELRQQEVMRERDRERQQSSEQLLVHANGEGGGGAAVGSIKSRAAGLSPSKLRQKSRERVLDVRKGEVCRTSSNATSVSSGGKGDVEHDPEDDDYEYPIDTKAATATPTMKAKGLSTTKTYLNGGRDNNNSVNISIRGNSAGISAEHRAPGVPADSRLHPQPYATTSIGINGGGGGSVRRREQPSTPSQQRSQRSAQGHSSRARLGPHHPSPSPSRKAAAAPAATEPPAKNSPRKSAKSAVQPNVGGKPRQSIFATKARDDLVPCKICGRNFAEDRVERHQDICAKTSKKKRKAYDSTKKRVQGTDAETFVLNPKRRGARAGSKPVSAAAATHASTALTSQQQQGASSTGKKSDWRKKREEFINALRAAKAAQRHIAAGGKISDLPPPPPMDTSDYIQCPHCGRKFAEAAADRHIPKCKNIKSNKR